MIDHSVSKRITHWSPSSQILFYNTSRPGLMKQKPVEALILLVLISPAEYLGACGFISELISIGCSVWNHVERTKELNSISDVFGSFERKTGHSSWVSDCFSMKMI